MIGGQNYLLFLTRKTLSVKIHPVGKNGLFRSELFGMYDVNWSGTLPWEVNRHDYCSSPEGQAVWS
jgi:hypothetical protein